MDKIEALKALRARIPTFHCPEWCHECCCFGVMATETELARMPKERLSSVGCRFVTDHGCGCYEERPILCRTYGVTDDGSVFDCAFGYKPDKPWTVAQVAEVIAEYHDLTKDDEVAITGKGQQLNPESGEIYGKENQ
jgi:hypothetical protein